MKVLGHERLAVDRGLGAHLGAGRQVRKLGASLIVGRRVSRLTPFTVRRTAWPAMLLPIASRTTRTVTVPVGSSARRNRAAVDQRRVGHRDLRDGRDRQGTRPNAHKRSNASRVS